MRLNKEDIENSLKELPFNAEKPRIKVWLSKRKNPKKPKKPDGTQTISYTLEWIIDEKRNFKSLGRADQQLAKLLHQLKIEELNHPERYLERVAILETPRPPTLTLEERYDALSLKAAKFSRANLANVKLKDGNLVFRYGRGKKEHNLILYYDDQDSDVWAFWRHAEKTGWRAKKMTRNQYNFKMGREHGTKIDLPLFEEPMVCFPMRETDEAESAWIKADLDDWDF